MNIVGLGNAGCQIAKSFENYGQYKIFCIDVEDKGYPTFLSLEYQKSHEDYEKKQRKIREERGDDDNKHKEYKSYD